MLQIQNREGDDDDGQRQHRRNHHHTPAEARDPGQKNWSRGWDGETSVASPRPRAES
jgi:hypothetical protein